MPRVGLEPVAFLSYAHLDDVQGSRVTKLRVDLEQELYERSGQHIKIFQDRSDIKAGDVWRTTLETGLSQVLFLLPVVSPAFVASDECLREFTQFLALERAERNKRGARRRIIPIYWAEIDLPGLLAEAEERNDTRRAEMLRVLADRQHHDLRLLRNQRRTSGAYVREIGRLAKIIKDLLPEPPSLRSRLTAKAAAAFGGRGRRGAAAGTVLTLVVLLILLALGVLPPGGDGRHVTPMDAADSTPCGVSTLLPVRSQQQAAIPGKIQCVGIRTDLPGTFSRADTQAGGTAPPAAPATDGPLTSAAEASTEAVWRQIVNENKRVARESGADTRYLTVVLAGHLSTGESTDAVDNVELLTALTAMRTFNARQDGDLRMRLWAANFGGDGEFALQSATKIAEKAADSGPVIVVGLGQTRANSEEAIKRIGLVDDGGRFDVFSGVTMIAATQSGTELTGQPGYFRIGASDDRQAEMGLSWTPLAQLGRVVPFIVYDQADAWGLSMFNAYSHKLASPEYRSRFSGTPFDSLIKDRVIAYSTSKDPGESRPLTKALVNSREQICSDNPVENGQEVVGAPRLIIFAGRAEDLPGLLDHLMTLPVECRRNIHVLGGDALADLRDEQAWDSVRRFLERDSDSRPKLLFSVFGPEDQKSASVLRDAGLIADFTPAEKEFSAVRDLLPKMDRDEFATFPDSAAWALYDAVSLAGEVAERVEACQTHPSADDGCADLKAEADRVRGKAREHPERFDGFDLYAGLVEVYQGRRDFLGITGRLHPEAPDSPRTPSPEGEAGAGMDPTEKLMLVYELSATTSNPRLTFSCAIPASRAGAPVSTRCDDRDLRTGAP